METMISFIMKRDQISQMASVMTSGGNMSPGSTSNLTPSTPRHIPRPRKSRASISPSSEEPPIGQDVALLADGELSPGSISNDASSMRDGDEDFVLIDDEIKRAECLKAKKCVQFPDDNAIVSGYCEAWHAPFHKKLSQPEHATVLKPAIILDGYRNACKKMKCDPSKKVENQIKTFDVTENGRQKILSLKGEKVSHNQMECLEEIFRRVQFETIDFEYSYLDDEATVALAEMIEYYESTRRLNLSFNQKIGIRGWAAIFRLLKHTQCLEDIDLRYTSLNHRTMPQFARTLRSQNTITVLHLENCSIGSQSLLILVCALKMNHTLKELYLGENNLNPTDGAHIYQLITGNNSLELLDLRHNSLQDAGLSHICDALRDSESFERGKLNTLVIWNNRFTPAAMAHLEKALLLNTRLETLNVGCNHLSSAGIEMLKNSLIRSRTLKRLGLQACRLNCQAAIVLAEIIAESTSLLRIDIRDNPDIKSAGLLALHLAMKMNHTLTTLNIDPSCCLTNSKTKDMSDQFRSIYDDLLQLVERNRVNEEIRKHQLKENDSMDDFQYMLEFFRSFDSDVSALLTEMIDQIEAEIDRPQSNEKHLPESSSDALNQDENSIKLRSNSNPIGEMKNYTKPMRSVSLTCDHEEAVKHAARLMAMPREEQIPEFETSRNRLHAPEEDDERDATCLNVVKEEAKTAEGGEEAASQPRERAFSEPVNRPTIRRGRFAIQKSFSNTPTAVTRHIRRFSVEAVAAQQMPTAGRLSLTIPSCSQDSIDSIASAPSGSVHSPLATVSEATPRQLAPETSESEAAIEKSIKRVVGDLVNFASYENGEENLLLTPTLSKDKISLSEEFEQRTKVHIAQRSQQTLTSQSTESDCDIERQCRDVIRNIIKDIILIERGSIRIKSKKKPK